MNIEVCRSRVNYPVGTILLDDETNETFEVIECYREWVMEEYNFKLTLKEIKTEQ